MQTDDDNDDDDYDDGENGKKKHTHIQHKNRLISF